MNLEKARINDVIQIHQLIGYFADKDVMLARSLSEIYESIRDYFVIKEDERLIACVALHVSWSDLAEIKSLAVTESNQRGGIGTQLVKACLGEAEELGVPSVFCLTYRPGFFEKLGFSQVDKMELPRKVWTECYGCPKFPDCDEVALVHHFSEKEA